MTCKPPPYTRETGWAFHSDHSTDLFCTVDVRLDWQRCEPTPEPIDLHHAPEFNMLDLTPIDPTLLPVGARWMSLRFNIEDTNGTNENHCVPSDATDYEAPSPIDLDELVALAIEHDLWDGVIHEVTGDDTSKVIVRFNRGMAWR